MSPKKSVRKKPPVVWPEIVTKWIGTPISIWVHTFLFIGIFSLNWLGLSVDNILLILTTAVSLEAIYLAIFIQMSVNKTTQSLAEVEADIDEIQEDVEDLGEDIDEIQAEEDEDNIHDEKTQKILVGIEEQMQKLLADIESLKKS